MENKQLLISAIESIATKDTIINYNKPDHLPVQVLQTIVTAIDPEFQHYSKKHCNKTGKPIGQFPAKTIQDLIAIHGRERAKFALEQWHCSQYSIEWLYSDPQALRQLSKFDPVGYFVYATSKLFCPNYKTLQMMKFEVLEEKIRGHKAALNYYSGGEQQQERLTIANDLIRRLLGLVDPSCRSLGQFTQTSISAVIENTDRLNTYISELQNAIWKLLQDNLLDKKRLSSPSIANIKAEHGGSSAFYKQVRLHKLNEEESILYDLKDFMEEKAPDCIEVMVGRSKPKITPKTIDKPIELKFKQPQEKPALKINANPFATALGKLKECK